MDFPKCCVISIQSNGTCGTVNRCGRFFMFNNNLTRPEKFDDVSHCSKYR